jgi:hypothetical protein
MANSINRRSVVPYSTAARLFAGSDDAVTNESSVGAGSPLRDTDGSSLLIDATRESISDSEERGDIIARVVEAMRELQADAQDVGASVMSSPRNRVASIIQSVLDERLRDRRR